jgi:hypothetical protein
VVNATAIWKEFRNTIGAWCGNFSRVGDSTWPISSSI